MKVSVWDFLPPALFAGPPRGAVGEVEFVPVPRRDAVEMLASGEVDAALLPVLTVLQNTDLYDVFPAVGLSSWDYPFARLFLRDGLARRPTALVFEEGSELEALVGRIVLREHYGADVQVRTVTEGLLDAPEDAVVIVGPEAYRAATDRFEIDLGREWFELANYPMVWGTFAAPKGAVTDEAILALRDAVARLDVLRETRARSEEEDVIREFVENQVRLRLDDLAVASLTELCHYVYYYGEVTDYRVLPFRSLEEDDAARNEDVADDERPGEFQA